MRLFQERKDDNLPDDQCSEHVIYVRITEFLPLSSLLRKTPMWNETHRVEVLFFPLCSRRTMGRTTEPHPHVCTNSEAVCLHSHAAVPLQRSCLERQSQARKRHTERTHLIWLKIIETYSFLNTKSPFPSPFLKFLWLMDRHYIQI